MRSLLNSFTRTTSLPGDSSQALHGSRLGAIRRYIRAHIFCWVSLLAVALTGCATGTLTVPGESPGTLDVPRTTASQSTELPPVPPAISPGSGAAFSPSPPRPARSPAVRPGTALPQSSVSPGSLSLPGAELSPIEATQAANRGVAQLTPPAELWERIRRGFAMPNLESDLVKDRELYYAARPEYIARMTERSRKYMFHIVEELELRSMPTELALLPFIESAFNPQAVSSAKAAGMWQFMPATGRHFELKQNAFRDDRRDVLASTRAALDYLQKLHGMFGDWHLALAAYNWGEGSVGRAIAKNKRSGLGTGYLDLGMPAETRQYVPKLQAVKNIVAGPENFQVKLPLIENHPFFQTVTIVRDVDVEVAARLAEVSVEDFRALNPSANRPVLLAAGTPQILLPWDQAAVFQKNLQKSNGIQLASWTVWVAPSNLKTAEVAKRVGMDEGELRSVNHIPPRSIIKAGSALLVPRGQRIDADVASHIADHGQVGTTPEMSTRRTVVRAAKAETVASLAKRYGLSIAAVAEWNRISAQGTFAKGQQITLLLPVKGGASGQSKAVSGKRSPAKSAGTIRKKPRR